MQIFDLHCDTLTACKEENGENLQSCRGHINLEKLKQGGAMAQCFAVFTNAKAFADGAESDAHILAERCYSFYQKKRDMLYRELQKENTPLSMVRQKSDFFKNQQDRKISAILTLEEGMLLDGDISRLQEIYNDGVRLLTLTWNYENSLGYPHSENEQLHQKGLKEFGIRVVKEMNRLGMLIDVSHLSEGGFWNVVRYSEAPFFASHSCARALCNHSRNLTDQQLRAIGEKGGVVGINFYAPFLREKSTHSTIDDIIRHVLHAVNWAGIEGVGFGSDFDGIDCTLEMKDYSGYPILVQKLSHYFSQEEMEKLCYKNALRVFEEGMK